MATKQEVRIKEAFWVSPRTGCILLNCNWKWRGLPPVKLVSKALRTTHLRRAPADYIARFLGVYQEEDGKVTFCQEASRHPQIDISQTPVRVVGPFNDWGNGDHLDDWTLRPRTSEDGAVLWECTVDRARLECGHTGVAFKFVTTDWQWLHVMEEAPNRTVDVSGIVNFQYLPRRSGLHAFLFDVAGGRALVGSHKINLETAPEEAAVTLFPGLSFYDLKTDQPLGARVEENRQRWSFLGGSRSVTVFRVFAPRASRVKVEVFEELEDSEVQVHPMKLLSDGLTWEARVAGDLHGWYYYLRVDGKNDGQTTQFNPKMKILDPWALATVGPTGPGIVVDANRLPKISPEKVFTPPQWQDLIILESHVRDLAAKAPITLSTDERLGFRGLTKWIADDRCYVRKLGVNALELLPVQQFDSATREEYHWGYMTTSYFSPSAHYAEAPEEASQIEEFRALVDECHKQGLAVIMDVVYNHVGEPPFLLYLDKDYFFHVSPDGSLTNWSGCGNTLRSDSYMVKRLVIDSLKHLINTFGVDGFRFDLAELLTAEMIKEIEVELKAVKESIILIMEPWSFRGHIASRLRSMGVSFWNDGYREFIADYLRGKGNSEGLRYFMKGSVDYLTRFPSQSVNYLSSHDDRCWIDKITENAGHNGEEPTSNDLHRTHLMCAVLMSSVGIPMLAAGTDFVQSKTGINNTYLLGEVNALQYARIERFGATHAYFRKWIQFRQSEWGQLFRLFHKPSDGFLRLYGCEGKSSAALVFNADHSQGPRQILFVINPHFESVSIELEGIAEEGWMEIADRDHFNLKGIMNSRLDSSASRVEIGPVDCGVWVRGGQVVDPA